MPTYTQGSAPINTPIEIAIEEPIANGAPINLQPSTNYDQDSVTRAIGYLIKVSAPKNIESIEGFMAEILEFLNNRRREAPPSEIHQIAILILRIYLGGAQGAEILQDENYQFLTQYLYVRHPDINDLVLETHEAIANAYRIAQQDERMRVIDIDEVPVRPQMTDWQDRTIQGTEFEELQRQIAARNHQNLPGAVEENPTPTPQLERQMAPQVVAAHIPPVNLQEYNGVAQITETPEIPELATIDRVPVVGNCGCQCSIQ